MRTEVMRKRSILTAALVAAMIATSAMAAGSISQAITLAGDRLVTEQGGNGSWPGETGYTGSIVAGLANAYATGIASYKTAADTGGLYLLDSAAGNYYGDEAYALTRLSDISADADDNAWRTSVRDFYDVSVPSSPGGTPGYINQFTGTEPSTAVFYIANHVLAAYYVNANDKAIWRDGLIDFLAAVEDNTASCPVMSFGMATWALAQTGPMDSTPVDIAATGYWHNVTLADLPGLLLGHQVASGDNADSFYWRFDHTNGGAGFEVSGYTEDTTFGTLGLIAADDANPSLNYDANILAAREVLAEGVDGDGKVYEHIWLGSSVYNTYAGELLQALEPLPGDANLDGKVTIADFLTLQNNFNQHPAEQLGIWDRGRKQRTNDPRAGKRRTIVSGWFPVRSASQAACIKNEQADNLVLLSDKWTSWKMEDLKHVEAQGKTRVVFIAICIGVLAGRCVCGIVLYSAGRGSVSPTQLRIGYKNRTFCVGV